MNDLASLQTVPEDSSSTASSTSLITANLAALNEGRGVLESLSDEQYVASCQPAFRSTLGAHYRHLIEHYSCFLDSVQNGRELVCYASRARNGQIELDRSYALQQLNSVAEELCQLDPASLRGVSVEMRDQEGLPPASTNLERELLFLQSHTILHHAMIASMCRILGHEVPDN